MEGSLAWPCLVVNGHVDVIVIAKLLDCIQSFRRWLRDECFDSNLSPKLEHLAAADYIAWNLVDVIRQETNAG